jgi:hypothetical protein
MFLPQDVKQTRNAYHSFMASLCLAKKVNLNIFFSNIPLKSSKAKDAKSSPESQVAAQQAQMLSKAGKKSDDSKRVKLNASYSNLPSPAWKEVALALGPVQSARLRVLNRAMNQITWGSPYHRGVILDEDAVSRLTLPRLIEYVQQAPHLLGLVDTRMTSLLARNETGGRLPHVGASGAVPY